MTDTTFSPALPGATTRTAVGTGVRITEIDLLRGLVIVLMALDHVRDYFHAAASTGDPLDPATTTPLLYITRWITHLCAPTFVFLAGVSAFLQADRGKSTRELSWFLATRGVWLIVLEATLISFGWSFGVPYVFFLQVIWAIGWSMLALAGLIWLPRIAVLSIGVAIIALHNTLDPITAHDLGSFGMVWTFLHDGGPVIVGGTPVGLFAYPVLPWIGVIAFGYGMGAVFTQEPAKRGRTIFMLGLAMLALFLVLRFTMVYGDPMFATGPEAEFRDWRTQPNLTAAIMAFMDVQKYPPSLQYVLVTLGVVLTLWPLLARVQGPARSVLNTFGATPFFFYLLHIFLVHVLAIAANAAAGRDVGGLFDYFLNVFTRPERLDGLGFSLAWVYVAWIVVLAMLYPVCRWWQGVRARERKWWMSYL